MAAGVLKATVTALNQVINQMERGLRNSGHSHLTELCTPGFKGFPRLSAFRSSRQPS
jgi:hypothetical protein